MKNKSDPKSRYCLHAMTIEQAGNKVAACIKELDRIRKGAPFLQTEHLHDMLSKARKEGSKDKEKALLAMLRKEYSRRQDGRLRSGFGKPASNPVSCVTTTPQDVAPRLCTEARKTLLGYARAG